MVEAQHAPSLLAGTSFPTLGCRRRLLPDGWAIEGRPAVDNPAEADAVVRDPWGSGGEVEEQASSRARASYRKVAALHTLCCTRGGGVP